MILIICFVSIVIVLAAFFILSNPSERELEDIKEDTFDKMMLINMLRDKNMYEKIILVHEKTNGDRPIPNPKNDEADNLREYFSQILKSHYGKEICFIIKMGSSPNEVITVDNYIECNHNKKDQNHIYMFYSPDCNAACLPKIVIPGNGENIAVEVRL